MQENFIIGVNYWPARKAMYWWKAFDAVEVERDFACLSSHHINTIRVFLTWEDFQPRPDQVNKTSLDNLLITADLAAKHNLSLMPTFFCGHMSGVNWIPSWALQSKEQSQRFPVYSQGNLNMRIIRNFYHDQEIQQAQVLQIQKICSVLRGHPAISIYDLGNESSNCCIPNHREAGRKWLRAMSTAIHEGHPGSAITLGMHAEDLEENRHLWPQDVARYCSLLSMHGYPFYLSWVDEEDVYLLPFLGIITSWLGGAPVLFQEFGWPNKPSHIEQKAGQYNLVKTTLWSEDQIDDFYRRSLPLLQAAGMRGAFGWCFADYAPQLYDQPPLKENSHERYFGLTRWDGSVKPALVTLGSWASKPCLPPKLPSWLLHEDPDRFYDDPIDNLQRWFKAYKREMTVGLP
ncbi:MAG TPA: hypothetical protein PLM20_04890 [Syntrophomonadaceae bacterium]|nr:hypothetical protein [Syntrophomonadaceae bacterium]HQA08007.1 hypothetical protein [Syntrophomonadaceae bacterium]HQE23219.1 hypothetical protein [Syntrophomonadaceae bacterium]